MESSDCETQVTALPPLPAVIDPLQLRLGLRQYRDLMCNLQGAQGGRPRNKDASPPRDGITSQWCGVWPWTAAMYRAPPAGDVPCNECPRTIGSSINHQRDVEPYSPDGDKTYTPSHPVNSLTHTTKAEKTFQVIFFKNNIFLFFYGLTQ